MATDLRYQLSTGISLTEVDNEMVLLDLSNGSYYGLNHIGACVVRGIQKQTSLEQTISEIADQHQIEFSIVRSDIEQLIEQLVEQNLLVGQL